MKNVKIIKTASGREYDLTTLQVQQFEKELKRTSPCRSLSGIISYILGRDRYVLPFIAPDATIKATKNNGTTREFTLHGRTVLQDSQSHRKRQFYMGAVMLEWVP
jgi:hypothetical protein